MPVYCELMLSVADFLRQEYLEQALHAANGGCAEALATAMWNQSSYV